MPSHKTFITLKGIKEFFVDKCKEQNVGFSEKDFSLYLNLCENDFYQWLKDNFRYFSSENTLKKTINEA